jgi:FkbM family methyltransferase
MDLVGVIRGYLRRHVKFSLMGRSLWSFQTHLCPGPAARVRFFIAYFILAARALAGRQRSRAYRLRIRTAGRTRDWWVADPMEVTALWTVFVAGEYGDWLPVEKPRLIVDAGANVGSATLWFRERFPEARVIAIEPNPEAFERLSRNFAHDPQVTVVNAALADEDGTLSFALESATSLQGRLEDQRRGESIEVDALTLSSVRIRFADGARIDFLKLNIEGAEWPVLSTTLDGIGTIAMEIHEPVPGGRDPDDLLKEIATREGFELRQGFSQTLAPRQLRWLVPAASPALEPAPTRTS